MIRCPRCDGSQAEQYDLNGVRYCFACHEFHPYRPPDDDDLLVELAERMCAHAGTYFVEVDERPIPERRVPYYESLLRKHQRRHPRVIGWEIARPVGRLVVKVKRRE
jgi:hypothetical protein